MGSFTQSDSGRRRRGSAAADTFKPILTEKNSIVPGQVIVLLHADAAANVTSSIGGRTAMAGATDAATNFGVSDVDKALGKLNVTAITRLHPPAAPFIDGAMSAVAEPMGSTFQVHYAADTPVQKAVEMLAAVEGVEMAEAVRYRETLAMPNDPQFGAQWGLTRIHCPQAWDRTTGNNAIVVAVIDTGVDLDHPELAPLIVPGRDLVNLGSSPTAPAGFHFEGDFNTPDNDPMDEVGHGTHVAGTIACLSNNAAGVAGVTWQCRIMPVRVLARIVNNANPSDVRGTGSSADIAAGIRWATDHGARVINMSLGGPSDTTVERDAVAYAVAHGVVVVAAMGNAFQQGNPTSFPAAYPGVVAVGAIDQADHRAAFSQTGPHIDIAAPGVGIRSTVWNNSFATMQGTSMASPHVAGVAALILSIKPSLTSAQCADILRQTADPLKDNPADAVPNNNYGWGCVNALAAVNRASPPFSSSIICHHTSPITCVATAPIACHPSIAILCQTSPVVCHVQTTPITCHISGAVSCHSSPIVCHVNTTPITCLQSTPVACHPSVSVLCQPSVVTICQTNAIACQPTHNIGCQPSAVVTCPSGPICGPQSLACGVQSIACGHPGIPGNPGIGGFGMSAGWHNEDPYAPDYGTPQSG